MVRITAHLITSVATSNFSYLQLVLCSKLVYSNREKMKHTWITYMENMKYGLPKVSI